MDNPTVHLLGVSSGLGANNQGCAQGPIVLQENSDILEALPVNWVWETTIYPPEGAFSKLGALGAIADVSHRLAYEVNDFIQNQQKFAVIGGDNSISIGTWSGAAHALHKQGNIGLIWFDANLDSHTPSTSNTGNVHRMPIAHLLGYGETALASILDVESKIKPENLCLIGVRHYDKTEMDLLTRLNVKVFMMKDIQKKGIAAVIQEAIAHVSAHSIGYGLSIDVNVFDPEDAPGVGKTVPDGIKPDELLPSLKLMHADPKFIGAEIVEFNPEQDKDGKTKKVLCDLLEALFVAKS